MQRADTADLIPPHAYIFLKILILISLFMTKSMTPKTA